MNRYLKSICCTAGMLNVLLLQCCQQKEGVSFDEKIRIAIDSRKMPAIEKQREIYASPAWVQERSSRLSERLRTFRFNNLLTG